MLLWCTAEFGYLRLGDGFVQGSSIMPQKRNPVAIEHARAIGSKALGQATGIMLVRPQHAVRRHRGHRGRPAAARGPHVPRRGRAVTLVGGGDGAARSSTPRSSRGGRARAGSPSRSWPTRSCASTGWRSTRPTPSPGGIVKARGEDPAALHRRHHGRGVAGTARRADPLHGGAGRGHPEPAPLRRRPHDAGRPGAGGDGAPPLEASRRALGATGVGGGHARAARGRGRRAAARSAAL